MKGYKSNKQMSQYIYLIRSREFVNNGEPTYKIGKTTQELPVRLIRYPPGSKLILCLEVTDCHSLEKILIKKFHKIFVHRPEYGDEYFTGNVRTMIQTIYKTYDILETKFDVLKEQERIKQYIEKNKLKNKTQKNKTFESILSEELNPVDLDFGKPDENEDNIEDKDNMDSEDDDIDLSIELDNANLENKSDSKTLKTFFKHIYDNKPKWYKEGQLVRMSVIEEAYNDYFGGITPRNIISRNLNQKMFLASERTNKSVNKKLVYLNELRRYFI
jgi:hypothetical protein